MTEFTRGDLSVISLSGGEIFVEQVDNYLKQWRSGSDSFIIKPEWPRFGTGESKCLLHDSLRGHDVYILADTFNYGVTYKMYGQNVPMSPDDHFQDLKRLIGAVMGKASRISVIMPMLYEGRQHKRSARESLDCAIALQELINLGVSNILTFDAHDARVQNAIPCCGFDDVHPTYQMIKKLVKEYPDISLKRDDIMIVSPDEGGMSRCMYYSSVLGLDLGMFYKRRNYSIVVDG
ncbi:MAG: ribose-phosphate pyrophosphokinase-like domain-containing protein, partial [Clostridia bacterium]|nr:ribose-phosphate pyrophosphokinase-like domain-containing protein [Clostridia bacterium]